MNYLLDTNVVSELVRPGAEANVLRWIDGLAEEQTYISVVTLAEIRKGITCLPSGRRKDALDNWLSVDLVDRFNGRIIGVTVEIADAWGRLAASAKAKGVAFAVLDGFIAATAIAHELVVATRNTQDFVAYSVQLVDPWQIN